MGPITPILLTPRWTANYWVVTCEYSIHIEDIAVGYKLLSGALMNDITSALHASVKILNCIVSA